MAWEFRTFATGSFRRRGMRGALTLRFDEAGLIIASTSGVSLAVPTLRIERMRAGVDRANKGGPYYETRLWLKDDPSPLRIVVRPHELADYAAVIGGLAERLIPERLETGLSSSGRRWLLGILSLPLLAALAVWRLALWQQPLWQGLAVAAMPAILLFVVWVSTRAWVPRPVADVAPFKAALTGA